MIELRINSSRVDLKPQSEVTMDLTNPYLFYDKLPDSKISVPTVPLTPNNRRVFGYVDLPLVLGGFQQYVYQLFYGGQLLKEGFFVLAEAGNGYNGAYTDKGGDFFGDLQNRLLTETPLAPLPLTSGLTSGGFVFPTINNSDFFGTNAAAAGYLGQVNRHAAGVLDASQPTVPMARLTWLMEQLAALTGTTIDGSFFGSEWANLILYNTRALDGAAAIDPKQHLPELTVEGLFIELRKLLNLAYTLDGVNKRLTIDLWDNMIENAQVTDWSAKAVKGTVKTPELNKRLQLGSEIDGNDQLVKDRPAAMADYFSAGTVGNLATLKSKFSTLMMAAQTGSSQAQNDNGFPMARQVGQSVQFNQLTAKFSPRLLRWRGANLADNAGLTWRELAATNWKHTEALRAGTEYVRQDFALTAADLATFDFRKKVHVNGVNYFVVNLTVALPIRKVATCLLMRG